MNISFAFLLLIGLIVLKIQKNRLDGIRQKFLMSLLVLSVLLLFLVFLSVKVFTYDANTYLFSFQVKKVYTGFFFILSQVIQIYSIIYVWGIIFSIEKFYELRTALRTVFSILLLIIFAMFFVWDVKEFKEKKLADDKYEIGLIPGAAVWSKEKPSPIFEGRIRKAFELYHDGKIKNIILTGANAPGEISESEAAFRYLTNLGANPNDLIVEKETSTTTEQIKYIKFNENIQNDFSHILIISDSFHLPRIMQICKFLGVDVSAVASDYKLSFAKTIFYRTRESVALLLFWIFAI